MGTLEKSESAQSGSVPKSLWGGCLVAVIAGPLGIGLASLSPPWPAGEASKFVTGLATLASVVSFLVVLIRTGVRGNRITRATWQFSSGLVGLIFYALTSFGFVSTVSQQHDGREESVTIVRGFTYTPDALSVIKQQGPSVQGLVDALGVEENIWTWESLYMVRVALILLFCAAFCALSAGLANAILAVSDNRRARVLAEGP